MLPFSCTTVTDYEVAVLKNPITGSVADNSVGQGLYFAAPAIFWKQYSKYDTREIQPPPTVRQAIELKLQREQEVQAQKFQTEIVMEQAEQKRQEALGIRDAQEIIGASLTAEYLSYFYMQTLQHVGESEGSVIIAPTEGGNLLFDVPTARRRQ